MEVWVNIDHMCMGAGYTGLRGGHFSVLLGRQQLESCCKHSPASPPPLPCFTTTTPLHHHHHSTASPPPLPCITTTTHHSFFTTPLHFLPQRCMDNIREPYSTPPCPIYNLRLSCLPYTLLPTLLAHPAPAFPTLCHAHPTCKSHPPQVEHPKQRVEVDASAHVHCCSKVDDLDLYVYSVWKHGWGVNIC